MKASSIGIGSILALIAGLLGACEANESRSFIDHGGSADADTDADTDTDTDTDADTDSDTQSAADPEAELTVEITTPATGGVIEQGAAVVFEGTVSDSLHDPEELSIAWRSTLDGVLDTAAPDAAGKVSFSTVNLSPGFHLIHLTVTNPAGQVSAVTIDISICAWGTPDVFDFDLAGASWQVFGDATWQADGYLEMTGNDQDRQGAIFNVVDKINPGDVAISFEIMTGPNVGNGADGFAMSVVNALNPADLSSYLAAALPGCGLGYGVYQTMNISAFHVEIDTWNNIYNGDTELHSDPTPENHIAVTLDGDPGTHHIWSAVPNIEDMTWHTVTIDITGAKVVITLDGDTVMNDEIGGFSFRGGYIGFTGSTGYYTNYHRFDNLQILDQCIVPDF